MKHLSIAWLVVQYNHAGQVCISVQRISVHADIYANVKKKMIAKMKQLKATNPELESAMVGPMS